MNIVKITTQNNSKMFHVIWNPRIISLNTPSELNADKVYGSIEFEGPEGTSVSVDLKTPIELLDTRKISCHNAKERLEINFDIKKSVNSYFFYLTASSSVNNESFIPSMSQVVCNTSNFYVKITVLGDKKTEVKLPIKTIQVGIKKYIETITSYPKPILFQVYAKSRNKSILIQLLQLLTEYNQNYHIIYGIEHESILHTIELKRNQRTSLSELINKQGTLISQYVEKIFNPFSHDELIKKGLGISSRKIYDNLEFYLPKPSIIVLYNAKKFRPLLEKSLIPKYHDRTFIFLEEG
jgi:hypothetical protein